MFKHTSICYIILNIFKFFLLRLPNFNTQQPNFFKIEQVEKKHENSLKLK